MLQLHKVLPIITKIKNKEKKIICANKIKLHKLKIPTKKSSPAEVATYMMGAGTMSGDLKKYLGPYSGIKNVWKDQPCYIIGGGPSLKDIIDTEGWSFFDGKHTIGINHAIEDYDRFEWFLFLDKRFLDLTNYNLDNFTGRIFASNKTGMKASDKITIFKTKDNQVSTQIEDGLYSSSLSGLVALNLAILTGANPIYLCGMGMTGKETAENYHYKETYTGETKSEERFRKFRRVMKHFGNFSFYKDRVKNIGATISPFETISFDSIRKNQPALKVLGRDPVIAHLSFCAQVEKHADITRGIIENCYGRHSLHKFDDIPQADLYILEHFISTRDAIKAFPHKMKSINIAHSVNCWDKGPFLSTIALTNTWKNQLVAHGMDANRISVISGGIDLDQYTQIPDYSKAVFGRMTRWSPGKIPGWWGAFTDNMLNQNKHAECKMFVQFVHRRPAPIQRDRLSYDNTVKIY